MRFLEILLGGFDNQLMDSSETSHTLQHVAWVILIHTVWTFNDQKCQRNFTLFSTVGTAFVQYPN